MSTNYGYACKTCLKGDPQAAVHRPVQSIIIENCRSPKILQGWLDLLGPGSLEALMKLFEVDSNLWLQHGAWYGVQEAFEFAAEHRAQGHEIYVIDEYGNQPGQCFRTVLCEHCGTHYARCKREYGHDGPCDPEQKAS